MRFWPRAITGLEHNVLRVCVRCIITELLLPRRRITASAHDRRFSVTILNAYENHYRYCWCGVGGVHLPAAGRVPKYDFLIASRADDCAAERNTRKRVNEHVSATRRRMYKRVTCVSLYTYIHVYTPGCFLIDLLAKFNPYAADFECIWKYYPAREKIHFFDIGRYLYRYTVSYIIVYIVRENHFFTEYLIREGKILRTVNIIILFTSTKIYLHNTGLKG